MRPLIELQPGQLWHSARRGVTREVLLCGGPGNEPRNIRYRTESVECWTNEIEFQQWIAETGAVLWTSWDQTEGTGGRAKRPLPGLFPTSIWPQRNQ
jgi:hypothetical protein